MRIALTILCGLFSTASFGGATSMAVVGLGSGHQLVSAAGFYNLELLEVFGVKAVGQIGGRLSYFAGEKRTYQTGNTKDRVDFGIEKLELKATCHLALNSAVGFEIRHLPWNLGAGFNIDVFGYGYSPKKTNGDVSLNGSGINALRNAYNDVGTLYSEMYLSKRFDNSKIGVLVGTTHSVTQYRAESDLPGYRTRRFLNFADSYIVGVSHSY